LHEAWLVAGAPDFFFIEFGGTLNDQELCVHALPAIGILKNLHPAVSMLLLTELAYDGSEVKTRVIQQGLRDGLRHGITFDTLFARQPPDHEETAAEPLADYIIGKIIRTAVYGGRAPAVVVVPHFARPGLDGYLEYLAGHTKELRWVLCHDPPLSGSGSTRCRSDTGPRARQSLSRRHCTRAAWRPTGRSYQAA
jgi:hypothetical protein